MSCFGSPARWCRGVAVVKRRLCWDWQEDKKAEQGFNFWDVLIPSYQPGNAEREPLSGRWGFGELLLITAVVLSRLNGLNNILSAFMISHNMLECKEVHFLLFIVDGRSNLEHINLHKNGVWGFIACVAPSGVSRCSDPVVQGVFQR